MARNFFSRFTRTRPQRVSALDGQELKKAFLAGYAWLDRHKEAINALNVYPVPDGDTGKNMTLTMAAAVKALGDSNDISAASIAREFARGALMGARGNSGSILSQILGGFRDAIGDNATITPTDFANGLRQGAKAAYLCVEKPVEGTILTVSREAAEAAMESAERGSTFVQLLEDTVRAGNASVERTPSLLAKLKDAGVVDAGGQGYVTVLEGMLRYLQGAPVEHMPRVEREAVAETHRGIVEIEEEFGYEVVFLLRGENLDVNAIRHTINGMGGVSTVVAGDSQMLKVHTHTPTPGKILDYGVSLGSLLDINVENLQEQSLQYAEESARERGLTTMDLHSHATTAPTSANGASALASMNGARPADSPVTPGAPTMPSQPVEEREVGVVAVVAGDGWANIYASYRLGGIVPGGQTMNPSTEDLLRAVEACPSDRVILLPNNSNVIMSARQVAQLTRKQVHVTPTTSMPQGIAALLAFNHQADFSTNAAAMDKAIADIATGEITRAVRDAQMDGVAVSAGDIIGLANGKLATSGHDQAQVLHDLLRRMGAGEREIITLFSGQDVSSADADAMAERVRAWFPHQEIEVQRGGQPFYEYVVSAE
ncbi:MAG TPA: DAK2 domain-containing protein [Ktedonobacterales bacterium]|jgi:DAK2 domain fusion protein YloV|nr:DAK2 domain-containing protein [Ktedonobacterales bacterium]